MDGMDIWRWAKTSQMRVVESCTWMQSPRVEWLVKTVHTWESVLQYWNMSKFILFIKSLKVSSVVNFRDILSNGHNGNL